MSALERPASHDLVLPVTGELVNLTDPQQVAHGLVQLRDLIAELRDVRRVLVDAVVEESTRQGTKTLHLDGVDVQIADGPTVEFDPQLLRDALLDAGCPLERVDAAVTPTVAFKVNRSVLRQLSSANAAYNEAINSAGSWVERPYQVRVTT